MWLDKLPLGVTSLIAAQVSLGKRCPDALHLAESSEHQRHAMTVTLPGRLCSDDEHFDRWLAVYGEKLHDVCARHLSIVDEDRDSVILDVMRRPSIRCALVRPRDALLEALQNCVSLEMLSLSLDMWTAFIDEMVPRNLRRLSVSRLKLKCIHREEAHVCSLLRVLFPGDDEEGLASMCPQLRGLEICTCESYGNEMPYWYEIARLNQLEELSIHKFFPESIQGHLCSKLKSLRLDFRSWHAISAPFADDVAHSLTALSCSICEDSVDLLAKCTRLKEMALEIVGEGDVQLADVIANMPQLRIVDLKWSPAYDPNDWRTGYIEPSVGVLEHMMSAGRNIQAVHLRNVRVGGRVLENMLEILGERLKALTICIAEQEETAQRRFERVLQSLIRWNSGLKQLRVDEGRWDGTNTECGIYYYYWVSVGVGRAERGILQRLIEVMKRKLGLLDVRNIELCADAVCRVNRPEIDECSASLCDEEASVWDVWGS